MSNAPPPTPAPPHKNNAWIWFFVFIFIASVGLAVFMIWFNLSVQLTREKLTAAWTLWKEKGPKNYDMEYVKRINDDTKAIKYQVKVRNGVVLEVKQGNQLLVKNSEQQDDPRIYHSMDNFFRDAERFLDLDAKADAKKVYVTAVFDDKNGAMLRYIRRVMGGKERIEIQVKLDVKD